MTSIDPALLQAQWLQYQNSQLAQSAIIPQYQQQYAPHQSQGEFVRSEVLDAITDFVEKSGIAVNDASAYVGYLEQSIANLGAEYARLVEFSAAQDALIQKFLFSRDFALQYARWAWIQNPVDNDFMSNFADVYLEIASLSPLSQHQNRDPYMGDPSTRFDAIVPQQVPTPSRSSIPPLPSSNESSPYITLDQYLVAHQQGQVAQARAAALQNPAGLYGALFQ